VIWKILLIPAGSPSHQNIFSGNVLVRLRLTSISTSNRKKKLH
jgi:hypothetical protein